MVWTRKINEDKNAIKYILYTQNKKSTVSNACYCICDSPFHTIYENEMEEDFVTVLILNVKRKLFFEP